MAENFGRYLPQDSPKECVQRRRYQKRTTYLALITQVLQDCPDRMLTFSEMMQKIQQIVSGDRKGLENNIRVCLSTNSCFIKVPMRTDMPLAKRNYWKVDESRITEKMVRRHFKGISEPSPLSSTEKMENRPTTEPSGSDSPTPAGHHAQKDQMKFSSSFSIESLLKRNSSSSHPGPRLRAEQLPRREERKVGMKRRMSWDSPVQTDRVPPTADSYFMYTPGGDIDRGFHAYMPTKRIRSMVDLPFFANTSEPPHFMIVQRPASEYDYNAHNLRL